jgi:hypothetical protein
MARVRLSKSHKLRLFASLPSPSCQDSLDWRSLHWDEAVVEQAGPPVSRRGKESKSGYDVWLHPWRVLYGQDDPPSPDVDDDDDSCHARSCRFSRC